MHVARVAALMLVSIATLAQQQSVEILAEPSHHLAFENAFVRVFDVTVAPKTSTLVHRHNKDYVFVTLGDSDVVSARPGEKPVSLLLKDGEMRYTPGQFEHAAINQSDKPFHNITIELQKPATNVKSCTSDCQQAPCATGKCPTLEQQITSDQWKMYLLRSSDLVPMPNSSQSNTLLVAVSDLQIQHDLDGATPVKLAPGGMIWLPINDVQALKSATSAPARYVLLEFAEKQ